MMRRVSDESQKNMTASHFLLVSCVEARVRGCAGCNSTVAITPSPALGLLSD